MKSPLAALFALSVLVAQTPNSPTIPQETDVNSELLKLVIYDQWDRGNDMFGDHHPTGDEKVDWNEVGKRDQERRDAVKKLLADGKLQTAKDYRFAALIFQHSTDTAGYLLAHVLAMTAVSKGDGYSKWLAAATMDRYLHSLNQPQVFGTQFRQPDGVWSKEPFDRAQLSDAVRAIWCVIPLAEQDVIEKGVRDGKAVGGTQIKGCR